MVQCIWINDRRFTQLFNEEFEDTKGLIRIRKSKYRQNNDQKKKYKQRSTKNK